VSLAGGRKRRVLFVTPERDTAAAIAADDAFLRWRLRPVVIILFSFWEDNTYYNIPREILSSRTSLS
jgi:hypothetical protein